MSAKQKPALERWQDRITTDRAARFMARFEDWAQYRRRAKRSWGAQVWAWIVGRL